MSLLWDQHASLPLHLDAEVGPLTRFTHPGPTFVSINAGYSPHDFADATRLLHYYRTAIHRTPPAAPHRRRPADPGDPGTSPTTRPADIAAVLGADFLRRMW
ncbi:hypothetical protein [Nocardia jiangsuensis]|uniref:Uncharacterized protein n=1 Tax=Nocardia jiangsuensis TaxID=1691563 RepID=A0ABV8DZ78_9NOCA